jgi:hypothetical protein
LLWLLQSLLGQNIHRFSSNGWKEDKRAEQQRNNDQTNMRRRDITTSSRCFHIAKLFLLRGKSCNFLVFFYVLLLLNSRLTRNSRNYLLTAKIFIPKRASTPERNFGYLGLEKKVATGLLVHIFEWNSSDILYFGIFNIVPMGDVTCLSNKNNGRLLHHLMIIQPPHKRMRIVLRDV